MSDRTAIVFYCKVCEGLMYAAVNDEHIKSEARAIAKYIRDGYKMAEIPTEEVRSSKWCECD